MLTFITFIDRIKYRDYQAALNLKRYGEMVLEQSVS